VLQRRHGTNGAFRAGELRVLLRLSVSTTAALLAACIEFSPFETDLAEDERAQTRRNLAWLAALPDPGEHLQFAVVADSHQHVDELSTIVDAINGRPGIDFVAHLGDLTDVGLREEYRATLEALKRLRVPFVTVIGNHDAISNGKLVYREMFGPYDYVFRRGLTRFVCFNSNSLEFGSVPDLEWLDEQTANRDGVSRVVALTHQPSREPDYAQVLERNRTDLLVTAHRHSPGLDSGGNAGELVRLSVDDALSGHWAIVTVSLGELGIASCVRNTCVEERP
jgi:Icc protein